VVVGSNIDPLHGLRTRSVVKCVASGIIDPTPYPVNENRSGREMAVANHGIGKGRGRLYLSPLRRAARGSLVSGKPSGPVIFRIRMVASADLIPSFTTSAPLDPWGAPNRLAVDIDRSAWLRPK